MKCRSQVVWIMVLLAAALGGAPGMAQEVLDPTNLLILGGGLSTGFTDFQLTEEFQRRAYPALMAQKMQTIMPLAGFRDPTPGLWISFNPQPDVLPEVNQSVLRVLPFPIFTFNLSVPFITVAESRNLRPETPFVHEGNFKQTMVNLILGYPALILENPPVWSQTEYAEAMAPTIVIVQLGFGDVIEGALNNDPSFITPPAQFASDYTALLDRIRQTHATILILNVPDPADTAYFSTIGEAARLYEISEQALLSAFALNPADRLSPGGLVEIGERLKGRAAGPLSPGSVLREPVAQTIRQTVLAYNALISGLASQNGFLLFDLHDFLARIDEEGIPAGSFHLGGGYGEGFYTRDGLFPSPTGHALLANRLLAQLNSEFGTVFPLVDIQAVADSDDFVVKANGKLPAANPAVSTTSPSLGRRGLNKGGSQ